MKAKELRLFLKENVDLKYQKFSTSLLPGVTDLWGVRLPVLRRIAKKIAKEGNVDLLKSSLKKPCFEERMVLGMAIGYLPWDETFLEKYVEPYIPLIDNWSICDSFCVGLKQVAKNQEETWHFLQKYFKSDLEYEVRFAVVLSLFYFLTDSYLSLVLDQLALIHQEDYYAQMAIAWAIAKAYAVSPEVTKKWIKKTKIKQEILKKALQKVRDSLVTKSCASAFERLI